MGGPHAAQPGPETQILTIPWREQQVLDHPAAPHLGQVIPNWDTSLERARRQPGKKECYSTSLN